MCSHTYSLLVIWRVFTPENLQCVHEKNCGQAQCVYHGDQPASLLEPVLISSMQAAGIVQDTFAEDFSLSTNHVPQFIQCKTGILWMLVDVYPASLEGTPRHLCVQGKVAKAWVFRKLTFSKHDQVLEVVAYGDYTLTWGQKFTSTTGQQRGKGT